MAPLFPAVLIGGPPHSGKSTLTYRLSDALRRRDIAHYVLRASPDGEGDWSYEVAQTLVATLRMRAKNDWSPQFATVMSRDIANRHLPLLVDAGGKVSPELEQIAAQCTHALLIAADTAELAPWRDFVARHGLPLIADLQSDLHSVQQIYDTGPTLRGVVSGLSKNLDSAGRCFDALIDRCTHLLSYDENELYRAHLALAHVELVIHVGRAIHPLPKHTPDIPWIPDELPVLIDSLPHDEPLGIYGRGPIWLYAAIAACNSPARCIVFDVRQGWVDPPTLLLSTEADRSKLCWDGITTHTDHTHIQLSIPGGYLDYREAVHLPVPVVSPDHGIVLDGKLPNWLWTALVRAYATPWIAIYQPRLEGAVVVQSQDNAVPIGKIVPINH